TMYLFDPEQGRRRRAVTRERAGSTLRRGGRFLRAGALDVSHRARGALAEARHVVHRDEPDDDILLARVRSALGHVCSNPHAIDVSVADGRVALHGLILREELDGLLLRVARIGGVKDVENLLEAHDGSERVPSLQGDRVVRSRSFWSPGTRLLALLALIGGIASVGVRARAVTRLEG
ncbi:MAG: BON domain-containing protein, partial [Deltaproteobacteria bacterium]|nr:BON domain-containing protein [Deltaproteobacteria bacterium]